MASESPLVSFLKNGNLRSLFSNDVVIIIGAWPGEPHVIQYKAEHPHMYVITFSKKGVNEVQKYNDNVLSPSHVQADFNNLEKWNNLKEVLKDRNVVQIIVDWSTTKFMNIKTVPPENEIGKWALNDGSIYNVVREMLTRAKGSFIFPINSEGYTDTSLPLKGKILSLFNASDESINYPLKNNSFYEVNNETQKIAIYSSLIKDPTNEITINKIKVFEQDYSEKFKALSTEKKIEKLEAIIDKRKSEKVGTNPKYCKISFP